MKQIYCFGPCRALPDFCKMCSTMTMASCPSSRMSFRQLLNLLKQFNLPSWRNVILVSQSPGSLWGLSAVGAVVVCEGQLKAGRVSPRTRHGVGTSQGTGTSPCPLAGARKSRCFFLKAEVSSRARSAWGLGAGGTAPVNPDAPEACMGKCQRGDGSVVVPAWSLMQYVARGCR